MLPGVKVLSRPRWLLSVMSASMNLQQPGFDSMSAAPVATEDHMVCLGFDAIWNHCVGPQGPHCSQSHTDLGATYCNPGHGDVQVNTAVEKLVWVCDLTAVGVCVDVQCSCYHQGPWRQQNLGTQWCQRAMLLLKLF